ncbi:hypothetical protein DUNSADRAFT_11490 [Dunaliella salina]|uniref:Uncharacterized protein n=1 Tax=Dunaliella salina TaxID=3046 RepID=A0ABQ7GD96_DUNSA|nr:hypothetical protein DUNSADRAFT_11490 [Dunaliella salina]|eukprot:KAF5832560.1 hypothetical protein DUNSADRAFT_11490 [Dunaliella salina]
MYTSWRTAVSRRGRHGKDWPLLCSAEEAPDKERLRMPVQACGVSLGFLLRLHDSLLELGLEGRARTTTMIVAKLLSPAGILQPTQRPSTPQQAQHTLQRASLDSRGRKSGEDGPRGHSLDLMRASLDTRLQGMTPPKGQQRGPNFASTPGLQSAKEVRTRLWDLIDPHWCGKPSYYVCYAWRGDFLEMLATVVDRVSRQQDHKEEISEGEFKVDLNAIYVWLDVLALPQQYLGSTTTLDGPIFGPPPGLFDVQTARDVVCSCDRGMVIMLDRDMAVLSRTWPLFEVWLAAYYCSQDASTSRVYAAIPKGIHVSMLLHLQTSCLSGLDLGRTTSSRPEDKQHIMVEVRHASGQKRMQVLTSESILRATRGWLRWSGEPQDMALYAALMLQSKEYAQLQVSMSIELESCKTWPSMLRSCCSPRSAHSCG